MRVLSAIAIIAGLTGAPLAQAQQHGHAAAATGEAPVQRYAADAVLSEHMQGIRSAVEGLGHYEHGHMGPEMAGQLAGQVEAHVRAIIANCKLAPEADAALHAIIVPLLQQAAALKQDPGNLTAIPPMRDALARYARQFDDPGFATGMPRTDPPR